MFTTAPQLVPIVSQMNSVHISPTYFPKIHSNIFPSTCRSSEWFLPFRFSDKNFVCFHLSYACYMPRLPYSRFDSPSNIWRSAQIIMLLFMRSSPAYRHFQPFSSAPCSPTPLIYFHKIPRPKIWDGIKTAHHFRNNSNYKRTWQL